MMLTNNEISSFWKFMDLYSVVGSYYDNRIALKYIIETEQLRKVLYKIGLDISHRDTISYWLMCVAEYNQAISDVYNTRLYHIDLIKRIIKNE